MMLSLDCGCTEEAFIVRRNYEFGRRLCISEIMFCDDAWLLKNEAMQRDISLNE